MEPAAVQAGANHDTVCFRSSYSSLSAVSTGERMRRPALYSSSRSGRSGQEDSPTATLEPAQAAPAARRRINLSSTRLLWAAIVVLAAALAFTFTHGMQTGQRKLTQEDINA